MKLRPLGDAPDWIDVGDELFLPVRFQVQITEHAVPGVETIDMTLSVVEGDRLICEEIRFVGESGGRGVTTESLRDIPMAALLAEVAFTVAYTHVDSPDWVAEPEFVRIPVSAASSEHQERARAKFGGRRRRRIDRQLLEDVAEIYGAAGFAPTQAVADRYIVDHSTAARWVAKARAEGLLSDTTQGRPSQPPKSTTKKRTTTKGAK